MLAVVLTALLGTAVGHASATTTPTRTTTKASAAASKAGADWLRINAHPIRTLDVASADMSDLAPLKTSLKGVQVVMLGETTHGDGTTFLAKSRLIRYLHEQLGFDVLAFESGLYDVEIAWAQTKKGTTPAQAIDASVFALWTKSAQVAPLINYISAQAKTKRPLDLTGFDSQFTGSISGERFAPDLDAFLSGLGLSLNGTGRSTLRPTLAGLIAGRGTPSAKDQQLFATQLSGLVNDISTKSKATDLNAQFWVQVLTGVGNQARMNWNINTTDFSKTPMAIQEIRDAQMAANLVWLAKQRYPNRKMIVWAASSHISRNSINLKWANAGEPFPVATTVMGDLVYKALGDAMFSVAFTAATGQWQLVTNRSSGPWDIDPPSTGSFEDAAVRAGLTNAYVDLRNQRATSWAGSNFIAAPMGYIKLSGRWRDSFDAIVFTKTMQPSTMR